ncbi:lipopolysaccharide biosynthesis protein [Yoonia sp. R2-816]|uniref:lipopolysaccharide biosynthesis protein n=1 Tax=Yoonia sp. R2-816 TaxID=3342638 RepID=UPI0037290087
MTASVFKGLTKGSAAPAMLLRAGIVAVNFAVMLGLAALLGLADFGRLAVIWGLALVFSSIIAAGAPLLLLQALSDGGRLTGRALAQHVIVYPLVLVAIGLIALPALFATLPWVPIFVAAFGIHLVSCLASIMRALGSVHVSMALRDAGPQLALGMGAILAMGHSNVLEITAVVLAVVAGLAAIWCWRQPAWPTIIHRSGRAARMPFGLWGTSVLGMALAQVDIIIGGAFLTDGQTGLYALLRRITNLVALPVSVATWVTSVPVAAAHGKGDRARLAHASANGSRIALIPGLVLCAVALAGLATTQLPGLRVWGAEGDLVFLILLAGALVQVGFAATFTVATLCGLAHFAAIARLGSIIAYLGLVGLIPVFSPVTNAAAYAMAMALGSVGLWVIVLRRLGIDTSFFALITARTASWRPS